MSALLRMVGLALGTTVMLGAAGASAQSSRACADGRVRVAGHCCWPGQSWSRQDRICEGAPECPGGLVESGEDCVPPQEGVATQPGPVPDPSAPAAAPLIPTTSVAPGVWPDAPSGGLGGLLNPRRSHVVGDEGLLIAGVTNFAIGYVAQVVFGLAVALSTLDYGSGGYYDYGSSAACRDQRIGWSFLPLIGPLLQLDFSCTIPFYDGETGRYLGETPASVRFAGYNIGGIAGITLELVGIGLFLGGLFAETERLEFGGGASLTLRAGAPGADAGGLSAEVVW